jgi:hypothetical protein
MKKEHIYREREEENELSMTETNHKLRRVLPQLERDRVLRRSRKVKTRLLGSK